jgi:hypothetical protein
MSTYFVNWRQTPTTNPTLLRPHSVFTDGQQQQQQTDHNTTTYCLLMDENNEKPNHNTTIINILGSHKTLWKETLLQLPILYHVILKLVFICQPIRIIFEFRFSSNQTFENHLCQVWTNLFQRFRLEKLIMKRVHEITSGDHKRQLLWTL